MRTTFHSQAHLQLLVLLKANVPAAPTTLPALPPPEIDRLTRGLRHALAGSRPSLPIAASFAASVPASLPIAAAVPLDISCGAVRGRFFYDESAANFFAHAECCCCSCCCCCCCCCLPTHPSATTPY
jgi:hypothetical protein